MIHFLLRFSPRTDVFSLWIHWNNYRFAVPSVFQLQGDHTTQSPREGSLQGVGEEAPINYRTSDWGGAEEQIFTLAELLRGSLEFDLPVYMCYVDLDKAYDRVPREILWGVIQRLYNQNKSCLRILGTSLNLFMVRLGHQGCPLSPILFVMFMGKNLRNSHGERNIWFWNLRVTFLLFAYDGVLLAFSSYDFHYALEQITAKWNDWDESLPLPWTWFTAGKGWSVSSVLERGPSLKSRSKVSWVFVH